MSPLAEALGDALDPDRGAAIATTIAMVAIVVCAPRDVRARWWAALRRQT